MPSKKDVIARYNQYILDKESRTSPETQGLNDLIEPVFLFTGTSLEYFRTQVAEYGEFRHNTGLINYSLSLPLAFNFAIERSTSFKQKQPIIIIVNSAIQPDIITRSTSAGKTDDFISPTLPKALIRSILLVSQSDQSSLMHHITDVRCLEQQFRQVPLEEI